MARAAVRLLRTCPAKTGAHPYRSGTARGIAFPFRAPTRRIFAALRVPPVRPSGGIGPAGSASRAFPAMIRHGNIRSVFLADRVHHSMNRGRAAIPPPTFR
jgi:hypothetical protein